MAEEEIYDEEGREEMVDDDEVSPEEDGFMQGYDDASEEKESEDKEENEDKEQEEE